MSICSCSYRALSRSRVTKTKTLTPFLYHTATIQQWRPVAQPISRRNASSRSKIDDEIPFEDEILPPSIEEAQSSRQSTITGSERAAFEKLYKKFKGPESSKGPSEEHELDQIADEYYEDDEESDPNAASLDSLFDAVLSGKFNADNGRKRTPAYKGRKPADLGTLAEGILKPDMDATRRKTKKEAATRPAKIKTMQTKEKERIRGLLEATNTDKELWDILEREVFAVIRAMDLDREKKKGKKGDAKEDSIKATPAGIDHEASRFPTTPTETPYNPDNHISRHDSRILFPNYPHHVIIAAQILRTNFPSSPLPLSIIPKLKSLGRSSYALGATTSLYKILIRTIWIQQGSYSQICSLLEDMDNGGIECDYGILNLLDAIINEYTIARSGRLGQPMQVVLGMEQFEDGMKRLQAWKETVAKRLGAWSEQKIQQGGIVRRVSPNVPKKTSEMHLSKGPEDELLVREVKADLEENVPLVEAAVNETGARVQAADVSQKERDAGGIPVIRPDGNV